MLSALLSNLALMRRAALVLGAAGVVWGVIETLVGLEVLAADVALSPLDGRTGSAIGIGVLVAWLCGLGGTALVTRHPAIGATLLFLAASGGFLLVGAPWIGPGVLFSLAAWFALLAIPNPFQGEMDREAADRVREASESSTAPQA